MNKLWVARNSLLQKFRMFFSKLTSYRVVITPITKVSYVFPLNQRVIGWPITKFAMFFEIVKKNGWPKTHYYKSFVCFSPKSASYWVIITKFAMFFEIVNK